MTVSDAGNIVPGPSNIKYQSESEPGCQSSYGITYKTIVDCISPAHKQTQIKLNAQKT